MVKQSAGLCYLCGMELGKAAMKTHIMKTHQGTEGDQRCYLLRIEGAADKNYWLYVDMPLDKSLSTLDTFLRKIWLECCGHMSAFRGAGYGEVGKARKLSALSVGDRLIHEYDFGSTTECVITILSETERAMQKQAIRLLARNIPPQFTCESCRKPATIICCECMYDIANPFYCDDCIGLHGHEMCLPITNSPRMGECGYAGELDEFEYNPDVTQEAR